MHTRVLKENGWKQHKVAQKHIPVVSYDRGTTDITPGLVKKTGSDERAVFLKITRLRELNVQSNEKRAEHNVLLLNVLHTQVEFVVTHDIQDDGLTVADAGRVCVSV